MAEPGPCVKCHKVSKVWAFGMCRPCYTRHIRTINLRPCVKCHVPSEIYANEICRKCYRKLPEVKEKKKLVASQRHRQCIVCHEVCEIYGFDMCRKCYRKTPSQKETAKIYRQKQESKARKNRHRQEPQIKAKRKLESRRYNKKDEIKARFRVGGRYHQKNREWHQKQPIKIDKCLGCIEEKKIFHNGLCRYCYDAQRFREKYGGRWKYRRMERPNKRAYRETDRYKIWLRDYTNYRSGDWSAEDAYRDRLLKAFRNLD